MLRYPSWQGNKQARANRSCRVSLASYAERTEADRLPANALTTEREDYIGRATLLQPLILLPHASQFKRQATRLNTQPPGIHAALHDRPRLFSHSYSRHHNCLNARSRFLCAFASLHLCVETVPSTQSRKDAKTQRTNERSIMTITIAVRFKNGFFNCRRLALI